MNEIRKEQIQREIDGLIDRKVRFTSSAHPGLTQTDIDSRLQKYDLEISELQEQLSQLETEE